MTARLDVPGHALAQESAGEALADVVYGDESVRQVIRPAAIVPQVSARLILAELALDDVRVGGVWFAEPTCWRRYDQPWNGPDSGPGTAELLGTLQIAYGTPTRYEITIYRATVTRHGVATGWDVARICDAALGYGRLSLATCPRASLPSPPAPFRQR